MSLTETAREVLGPIFNDSKTGGDDCTITTPAGVVSDPFKVIGSDIHKFIDPDTGMMVSGRKVHVTLLLEELRDAGLDGIEAVADPSARPWLFTVANAAGEEETFKVSETNPDDTGGMINIFGEAYIQ